MFTRRLFIISIVMAASIINGAGMAATKAGILEGNWKLDGAFAPSGETLTATIVELPEQQWRLVLPKDVKPEGMNGDAVLRQAEDNVFVSTSSDDVRIRITVTAPGKAQMTINIDNSKGFARFAYGMTRIGH